MGLLSEIKADQDTGKPGLDAALETAAAIKKADADIRLAMEESAVVARELERVRPWGDFDPALAAALAQAGFVVRLVEVPAKKLATLPEDLQYTKLGETKGTLRLAV